MRPTPHDDPRSPGTGPGWKRTRGATRDMAYLPRGRSAWDMTLAAYAYWARRQLARKPDLNLWAAMHHLPPSGLYAQLGDDALVCWHGTSAVRAGKIRQHGLIHRDGVWAATEPIIAHSFTRGRSMQFQAGSAMVVFVISKSQWDPHATPQSDHIVQFHRSVPPEAIQYILYSERMEFVGGSSADRPRPWGRARFKRSGGRWAPCSRPPVRFDADSTYDTFEQWLELSVRRILGALGRAATVEVFSSLYATLDPPGALEHSQILAALDRCAVAGQSKGMDVHRLP